MLHKPHQHISNLLIEIYYQVELCYEALESQLVENNTLQEHGHILMACLQEISYLMPQPIQMETENECNVLVK